MLGSALLAVLLALPAEQPASPRKSITIARVTSPPRLEDYRSGERRDGLTADTFLQREPNDLVPASERTEAYLSYDDANDTVAGWHVTNGHGGYYYIDVAEALAVEAPVEIKPVDLVTGVLALHIVTHPPLLQGKRLCLCGEEFDGLIEFRQHLAEKIVEVLS